MTSPLLTTASKATDVGFIFVLLNVPTVFLFASVAVTFAIGWLTVPLTVR